MSNFRLNIQGLSRKSKSLMSSMVADEGMVLVSSDSTSCEPSVITHYSNDPIYYQTSFGMVGKEPYYTDSGLLMIDDIYLQSASYSPMGSDKMREAFNADWGGKTFAQQWVEDSEVIKDALKNQLRQLHKIACLSGDTLVFVKDRGLVAIVDVKAGDLVWDGEQWVHTDGPVFKGYKDTVELQGVRLTKDHKILTKQGWKKLYETRTYQRPNDSAVCEKEFERLRGVSPSWTEIWRMVCSIGRTAIQCIWQTYRNFS